MIVTFVHITTFTILIPIFIGIRRFSKLELETQWLLYMLIPVAIIQFISIWWKIYVVENNMPFFYVYILLEILFLTKIYWLYLKKSRFRLMLPIVTTLFIIAYLLKFMFNWNSWWEYSTYLRTLEGVIVLIFASSYFINEYRKQEVMYLQRTASFWISSGLILYFSSNLLLFGFSELVFAQETSIFQSIWLIHTIVLILLYLSFTIAFLCKKKVTTF